MTKEKQLQKNSTQRIKKRDYKTNKNYFNWLRKNKSECIVCNNLAEIHHLHQGYKASDKEVIMLCLNHHSQQSQDGIHHSMTNWHNRFISKEECFRIAKRNYNEFKITHQD